MKKKENLDSKLQILTLNQEIFKNSRKLSLFYHCFYHVFINLFSFSLPVAPEIQENHENQWKTMENHQKQRKLKKNEVANEKKWKFGLKVADSHSEPGNFQKLEEIFIFLSFFLSFFYHFFSLSLPVAPEIQENHENQWKTMENHQKQRKMKKMKLQMKKKRSCKWKKMKLKMKKKWSLMAKGDERKRKKWKNNEQKMIFKFTQQNDMKIQMIMKMKKWKKYLFLMVSECSSKNLIRIGINTLDSSCIPFDPAGSASISEM